jgi:hypothetical protein
LVSSPKPSKVESTLAQEHPPHVVARESTAEAQVMGQDLQIPINLLQLCQNKHSRQKLE